MFHGGPLHDTQRPLYGSPPALRIDPEGKLRRIEVHNGRELTDEDRLYTLVYCAEDGTLIYRWFDGWRCDFCDGRPVVWDYPGRDFTTEVDRDTSEIKGFQSLGEGWGACEECSELIERADRAGLHRRAVKLLTTRGPKVIESAVDRRSWAKGLRKIQDDFFANRTGSRKRVS